MHNINSLLKYPIVGKTYLSNTQFKPVEARVLYFKDARIYCHLKSRKTEQYIDYTLEDFIHYYDQIHLP